MISTILRFIRKDDGATAIEYGLIAAGIATVLIAGIAAFGGDLSSLFTDLGAELSVGDDA